MIEKRNHNSAFIHFVRNWVVFGLLVVFLTSTGVVFAQEDSPDFPSDNDVNAIAKQLYCPVCENIPLDVCPTQACAEWRNLIRLKLVDGWNDEQIKNYFVEQYGARVLATPPASGFNWLVYVIPPIAIILGSFFVYKSFQSMRSSNEPESDIEIYTELEDGEKDDYVKRLEEELRNR